jgi:alkylation response protein AidB-like acyl-CoA dehydrogenase
MIELTEEQLAVQDTVVEFGQRRLNVPPGQRDGDAPFRERWRQCADIGLQGLPIPVEYGGQGADAVTTVVALVALGYGCTDNGFIFALNAHMWAGQIPILRFGTPEQKRRYLPGLCDGSLIAAFGVTEPASGSDALSLTTTARRSNGHYVLNGTKAFVTNGPDADVFVVLATTDPALRFAGLCAFVIERGTPGCGVGANGRKMGLETSGISELILDDCEVSSSCMLGRPGAGMALLQTTLHYERGFILCSCLGTMQRQLERCIEHARERKQFGQPINEFQGIQFKLADMETKTAAARELLYKACAMADRNDPGLGKYTSMAKLFASDAAMEVTVEAVQVLGGYGYVNDYPVERMMRDAKITQIYEGTNEIQRVVIARAMAK